MNTPTLATRSLDCGKRLRLRYQLNACLDAESFQRLADVAPATLGVEVRTDVHAFSKMVMGAKDLFMLTHGDWYASAVRDSDELVVTFGRLGKDAKPGAMAGFDSLLCAAGFGPIEHDSDLEQAA